MSVITNIILKTSIEEAGVSAFEKELFLGVIPQRQNPLVKVDDFTKSRAFECDLYITALNYIDILDLLDAMNKTKWEFPEEVQLMIQEQSEDVFTIYIPNNP
jgi:hypothetical protein